MSIRIIEVVDYNPNWSKLFEEEYNLLRRTLHDVTEKIHHIGSTSVPGLASKPIIDILIEVYSLEALDTHYGAMISIGYKPKGEFGIPGRRYFYKGGNKRTHHVHAFKTGDLNVIRHIAFRDYLLANPDIAQEYGQLKNTVARACDNDAECYCRSKDAFIKEHEAKAIQLMAPNDQMQPTQ